MLSESDGYERFLFDGILICIKQITLGLGENYETSGDHLGRGKCCLKI